MKNSKILLAILLMILGNGFLFSQNTSVTPGWITIGACSPIPEGLNPTAGAYKDLVDCGFNLGIARGSVDYFKQQFRLIGNLDFKYIVGSTVIFEQRKDYYQGLGEDRHLAGWILKDEPQYKDIDALSRQYKTMVKEDPRHLVYINLVGVTSEKMFTGNIKSYSSYLNLIQQKFSPQVWSYDFYPILIRNGELTVNYDQFYSDFEDMRAISQKTRKPFWAYCESMQYKTRSYSRPEPNEAYFRFEAFSALAYGAQGIIYWTYGMRPSSSTETYISSLVDLKGNKTNAWYDARKVNMDIKRFNDVFYQCKVMDVRHTGAKLYKGTRRLSGAFGPFSLIRSGDSGVLASRIVNGNDQYIVLVSHDVMNTQSVHLELQNGRKVMDITSERPTEYSGVTAINLTLDKGGILIFRIID